MQFSDCETLKAEYPDYDYTYVLNGQVNPSDLSLIHKAILDCGYMRASIDPAIFGEHILMSVPSFNMAFDALLEAARRDGDD